MKDGDILADELGAYLQDRSSEDGIQLSELLAEVGERGFGLLLILVSLPLLIPMPPGASVITGLITIFLAVQGILGRRTVWLPPRLLAYRIKPRHVQFLRAKALPVLKRVERIGHSHSSRRIGPSVNRLAAIVTAGIGIILVPPIPFFNTVPALVTLAIGIGLVKGNALALWIGIVAGGAIISAVVGGLVLFVPSWLG